jgi:uncharacterized protein (TIGR02466 family)
MNTMQQNKIEIFPLFSKVVYVKQTNINCENILKTINEKASVSGIPNQITKKYLALVSNNKKVLDQNKYKNLKKEVMKEFYHYAHDVLNYKNNKFKMTTSWFTKSNKNQESIYHNHNNCMFSGVLYLKINDNSGGINFTNYENFRFLLVATKYDTLNAKDFTIQPQTGTIIFFPSEMHHRILQNESNQERISLAFNFLPIGHIGTKYDSQAYIR